MKAPESLLAEGVSRVRQVITKAVYLARGTRLVAKADANGNIDPYWQRPDGTEMNLTGETLFARCTSNENNIGTSATSLTGDGDSSKVRLILPTVGEWSVEAVVYVQISATGSAFALGELFVNDSGSAETGIAVKTVSVVDRLCVPQRWKVTTTAANTPVELKVKKSAAQGTVNILATQTTLAASIGAGGGSSVEATSHGDLTDRGDDSKGHTIYTLKDGTRAFTGEQSMGTNKLTNVVDPAADQDAATKKYHDDNKYTNSEAVAAVEAEATLEFDAATIISTASGNLTLTPAGILRVLGTQADIGSGTDAVDLNIYPASQLTGVVIVGGDGTPVAVSPRLTINNTVTAGGKKFEVAGDTADAFWYNRTDSYYVFRQAWATKLTKLPGGIELVDDIAFKSGTANLGTFAHNISGARTWTLPDLAGTIAIEHPYSITVEAPDGSEDIGITFTKRAITVTEIRAVLVGSDTPSVTWTIRHHATDRNNAGIEVVTGGTTTTSTTAGSDVTGFNDATIPADSFIWLETTAQSGTVTQIEITIWYKVD